MKRSLFILALLPIATGRALAQAAPTENALKYLQQASKILKLDGYKPALPLAEARRLVQANAGVFPLLTHAIELPLRFDRDNFARMQLPIFSSVRNAARLLSLRAQVQAGDGDFDGAVNSNLQAVALGEKMQEDGALISALVGYAVEAVGSSALQRLAPQLDAPRLKSAARGLSALEQKRPPFATILKSEREVSQQIMREQFAQEKPPFDAATQKRLLEATREVSQRDDALLSRPFALTRGLDFRGPQAAPEGGQNADAFAEDKLPRVGPNFDAHAWAQAGQKTLRPLKFSVLVARTRSQARLALLEADLAARAYWRQNNAPPASLQVLVPDFLPALPADPFALNAPLRFKRAGDTVRFYSVGPDGLDDGGKEIEKVQGVLIIGADSLGDIVQDTAKPEPMQPVA